MKVNLLFCKFVAVLFLCRLLLVLCLLGVGYSQCNPELVNFRIIKYSQLIEQSTLTLDTKIRPRSRPVYAYTKIIPYSAMMNVTK